MRYTHDDPPWIDQKVEHGFWGDHENRVWYIGWLGELLGCESPEDWYKVKTEDLEKNYGSGVLKEYGYSIFKALQDVYPDHEWIPWLFVQAPQRFWRKPSNQHDYMNWLASQLGYSKPEDWYKISKKNFEKNHGFGLLAQYNNSPTEVVQQTYPEHEWVAWKFDKCPNGFWLDDDNIRAYLEWLGKVLNYSNTEDWYKINKKAFKDNYGSGVLQIAFHGTPSKAAYFHFPDYDWKPWLFNVTPRTWWALAENRKEYLQCLSEKLGYSKPEDWYGISKKAFELHSGARFLHYFDDSPSEAVMQSFPDFDWKPWLFHLTRRGWWDEWANRRAYMDWLGEKLGFGKREDWYQVRSRDFKNNSCAHLARIGCESYLDFVADAYPDYDWLPWKFRIVPNNYWDKRDNRVLYLKWLGRELNFSNPEDWYAVTVENFRGNHGSGLLTTKYRGIPFNAVKELYPSHDWRPWQFTKVGREFWKDGRNCRGYMLWLEEKLSLEKTKEWYRVQRSDFLRNHGASFLAGACGESILKAVEYMYPDFPWEPEKFRVGLVAQKRLHTCVKNLYPDNIVKWNFLHPDMEFSESGKKMELDVFLPELNLGFEYQGEGHYLPLSMWNGEEGLTRVKERDAEKRLACQAMNITLIEAPYWWDGSKAELKKMIEAGPGPAVRAGSD